MPKNTGAAVFGLSEVRTDQVLHARTSDDRVVTKTGVQEIPAGSTFLEPERE